MKATEELQKELNALLKEHREIKEFLSMVKLKEDRLRVLSDTWHNGKGLISKKKMEVVDSMLPLFDDSSYVNRLIESISEKWISIKGEGFSGTKQYKVINGWPKGSRDGYGAIDYEKAIRIWSGHLNKGSAK